MAFNLNKNEPADPSKKFDLSKTDPTFTVDSQQKGSRSKTLIFALLGLLIIGAGTWIFLSKSNSGSDNENSAAATVKPDSNNVISVVQNDVAVANTDTMKQPPVENVVSTDTSATSVSNTMPDPSNKNNNPDRTSAASFNNSIPATFTKGSFSIGNPDQQLVKELVVFLQKNPAAVIHVNGYASSEGDLAINQQISRSRAEAFKNYLISKGVPAKRINPAGKGIDNPIGSNDTEEGRIKNRRVEISLQ